MTKKSKRLYILNDEEINALYSLPKFSADEREIFFELTESETLAFNEIIDIPTKIHFILQLSYFKAKLRLFNYNYESVSDDLKFIIAKYFPDIKSNKTLLSKAQKLENNKIILSLFAFCEYEDKIRSKVLEYLISIARRLICHITICGELITYFNINKIVIPQYTVMQDLISFAIKIEEIRLTNKIEQSLTNELNLLLERMLTTQEKLGLNSFKKFPRDFKYRALKTEVNKGEDIVVPFV